MWVTVEQAFELLPNDCVKIHDQSPKGESICLALNCYAWRLPTARFSSTIR